MHGGAAERRPLIAGTSLGRALRGEERLWKVWWLGGAPLLLALAALSDGGKDLFLAGHPGWANLLGLLRFALYFAWFRIAWDCSRNVDRPEWTYTARVALGAGLVATALS